MPYIKQEQRKIIDPALDKLVEAVTDAAILYGGEMDGKDSRHGPLNYTITRLILRVLEVRRGQMRYVDMDRIRGLLVNIGVEFERRLGFDYESQAQSKNGDLPEYSWLEYGRRNKHLVNDSE